MLWWILDCDSTADGISVDWIGSIFGFCFSGFCFRLFFIARASRYPKVDTHINGTFFFPSSLFLAVRRMRRL